MASPLPLIQRMFFKLYRQSACVCVSVCVCLYVCRVMHFFASVTSEGSSPCKLPSNYYQRDVIHLINTSFFHGMTAACPVTSGLVHPGACSHLSPSHLHPASREVTSIFSTLMIGSQLPPAALSLMLLSSICCLMCLLKIPPAMSSVCGCRMEAIASCCAPL